MDSDLYFFADPAPLLRELTDSGRHAMITEHAYGPEHQYHEKFSGRFCVQFLTFRRTPEAAAIIRWWRDRCVEWCFARPEPGRFGDQMYLDQWPTLFPSSVHILQQKDKALAPWNVEAYERASGGAPLSPIFYHFHSLRFANTTELRLFAECYRVRKQGMGLYHRYLGSLRSCMKQACGKGFAPSGPIGRPTPLRPIVRWWLRLRRNLVLVPIQGWLTS